MICSRLNASPPTPRRALPIWFVAALSLFLLAGSVSAESGKFEIGPRFSILTAGGEPANDIPQIGAFLRYKLNDRWWLGFGVENSDEFDFERPAELLGLVQDPAVKVIDAKGSSTAFLAWIERVYGNDQRRLTWFWTAGVGFNSVDVNPVSGPLAGGGTFDLVTDAGSEFILSLGGGLRYYLGKNRRSALELAIRADQRFADWTIVDRQSGAVGTIDDYLASGLHFGYSFRF